MVLLNIEEFLIQLTNLVQSARNDSSFTLTLKRYDGQNQPKPREGRPPLPTTDEHMCLVRAKSKSKKLSTIVKHDDVPRIMEGYGLIMKLKMDGLKKVKKVKSKAKAAQG